MLHTFENKIQASEPISSMPQPTIADVARTDQIQPITDKVNSESSTLVSQNEDWIVYIKTNNVFSYQVEYPNNWYWEEDQNTTYFMPPGVTTNHESIAIVVFNDEETPPLPIQYTYTTIRTVQSGEELIAVQERTPSPVTEHYMASVKGGDYIAEFRFSLNRSYDETFDHMVSTFNFK